MTPKTGMKVYTTANNPFQPPNLFLGVVTSVQGATVVFMDNDRQADKQADRFIFKWRTGELNSFYRLEK